MSDELGHASVLLDQLKQAEADGDLPDELAAKHDLNGGTGDVDDELAEPEENDAE